MDIGHAGNSCVASYILRNFVYVAIAIPVSTAGLKCDQSLKDSSDSLSENVNFLEACPQTP